MQNQQITLHNTQIYVSNALLRQPRLQVNIYAALINCQSTFKGKAWLGKSLPYTTWHTIALSEITSDIQTCVHLQPTCTVMIKICSCNATQEMGLPSQQPTPIKTGNSYSVMPNHAPTILHNIKQPAVLSTHLHTF